MQPLTSARRSISSVGLERCIDIAEVTGSNPVSTTEDKSGMWRSPVAHTPGGRGAAGSNPVIPTTTERSVCLQAGLSWFLEQLRCWGLNHRLHGFAQIFWQPAVATALLPSHAVTCNLCTSVESVVNRCALGAQGTSNTKLKTRLHMFGANYILCMILGLEVTRHILRPDLIFRTSKFRGRHSYTIKPILPMIEDELC